MVFRAEAIANGRLREVVGRLKQYRRVSGVARRLLNLGSTIPEMRITSD